MPSTILEERFPTPTTRTPTSAAKSFGHVHPSHCPWKPQLSKATKSESVRGRRTPKSDKGNCNDWHWKEFAEGGGFATLILALLKLIHKYCGVLEALLNLGSSYLGYLKTRLEHTPGSNYPPGSNYKNMPDDAPAASGETHCIQLSTHA